ncbi:capsular polysaccharide biosynthesis protein Cps4B [Streptococcus plurextorum]|uniref:capsular polysaccharide biosynthesis protein Cps4B n=1 Tax=Streptococcus plurextorum TaxID=456876 RepID=UPI0004224F31|nr:capsular polysaccharide biosynthesis protein Cps4B [Streptococcus plurextorum]
MIDIHSHIVFGVDDGPKRIEDSIELLKESYAQGVRVVVATSHRRKGMFETPEATILTHFVALKKQVADLLPDLTLLYGGEIYFTSDVLKKLENQTFPTLNGTRFALIEFSGETSWKTIHEALMEVLALGITPVVAHIERYRALEFNKKRVQELIDMGCYTQVNSAHVLKAKLFGDGQKTYKKRAAYFLKEDLVHVIASDMHNLDTRRPHIKEAYALIEKQFGRAKAQQLFKNNQQTLLSNQFI